MNPFAGGPPTPGDLDGKADGDDSVSERKKKLKNSRRWVQLYYNTWSLNGVLILLGIMISFDQKNLRRVSHHQRQTEELRV